jgi:Bcr/CflA subfamily drug resistance transporter
MRPATVSPPRLSTLVLLAALSVLPVNLFLPSLANMAAEFRVDYALVNLSIAGYATVAAVLQLIMGPLSDRFGRRPVLLTGLAIFVAASVGCALAADIWTFLGFRMLQGVVISAYAVSLAVIQDTAGPRKAASLIGYVAMAWAVAPMLAPLLGGVLDELLGWRASFWTFVLLGGGLFTLCWIDLSETNQARADSMVSQLLAYPELLRSSRFWAYALCMAFSTGAFYAFLGGAPLVAASAFGLSTVELGVAIGSITGGFMFGSFLSGRYAGRFQLSTMMIAGRLVACGGLLLGLLVVLAGFVQVFTFFGACLFVGIGNGLTMPSSSAGALSVHPRLAGSASGLAGALTVGGGALISSLTGAVLTEANGTYALLGVMLASSFFGLAAALAVRSLDRRVAAASAPAA